MKLCMQRAGAVRIELYSGFTCHQDLSHQLQLVNQHLDQTYDSTIVFIWWFRINSFKQTFTHQRDQVERTQRRETFLHIFQSTLLLDLTTVLSWLQVHWIFLTLLCAWFTSVQFNSRRYVRARESPHALQPKTLYITRRFRSSLSLLWRARTGRRLFPLDR